MKTRRIISIILCIAVAALCLISCSDHGAPEHNTNSPSYAVTVEQQKAEFNKFMTEDRVDRTTFTDGEKATAEYLKERLIEMGCTGVVLQDFTATENEFKGNSQNVIAHIGSNSADAKNVIIGTYYDNRFNAPYKDASSDGAEAATGGVGIATLLSIADYLANHKSAMDSQLRVTIVFFGASYVSDTGARVFFDKMEADEYKNTVLMIELQRLCGDHIYAFSDARPTKREEFFDKVSATNGLNIYKVTTKTPLITGLSSLNGVPYYQWAHGGVYRNFFNAGIPTLNLIGANWETANLSDIESANRDNLTYTENDTRRNLEKFCPDYAEKMATAATLVIRSVCDGEFLSVMQYDREHFPDTDVLGWDWLWCLIVLVFVIAVFAVMTVISARLRKKHPIVVQAPPQMKMAVFGMDYEDKNSADIFIDIKSTGDEIFPGIENNAPRSNDPFDDIFPPTPPQERSADAQDSNKQESGGEQNEQSSDDGSENPPSDGQ